MEILDGNEEANRFTAFCSLSVTDAITNARAVNIRYEI